MFIMGVFITEEFPESQIPCIMDIFRWWLNLIDPEDIDEYRD